MGGEADFEKMACLEEYKEAGHYHRQHLVLMFGDLAIFLAANAGLIHLLNADPEPSPAWRIILPVAGLVLSFVFGRRHRVLYDRSSLARKRAIDLQDGLKMKLYQEGPKPSFLMGLGKTASMPTEALYWLSFSFWFVMAVYASVVFARN